MLQTVAVPPYDPELIASVGPMPSVVTNDEQFAAWRALPEMTVEIIQPLLDTLDLIHEEVIADTEHGDLLLSIVRPAAAEPGMAAMYDIHGGGMIFGNRFNSYLEETLRWVAEHQIAIISPEYTLAPEARAPQAALECFAGLTWVADSSEQLGIDSRRIILAGVSGGGGLAAAVGLLSRDNGGPDLLAQMLMCPQLDDRHTSVSSRQFSLANGAIDPWPDETNRFAWDAVLGESHENAEVSIYQAPARAEDLSNLPPTFLDTGANEVFRDPVVAYASRLWAHGVSAELHVWPGGFHGFDTLVPTAAVSLAAKRPRSDWLSRILAV